MQVSIVILCKQCSPAEHIQMATDLRDSVSRDQQWVLEFRNAPRDTRLLDIRSCMQCVCSHERLLRGDDR